MESKGPETQNKEIKIFLNMLPPNPIIQAFIIIFYHKFSNLIFKAQKKMITTFCLTVTAVTQWLLTELHKPINN